MAINTDNIISYSSVATTREKLVNTARYLFYEQGYTYTTLNHISAFSGINNGLITYYFGSKAKLASEIYTSFLLDLRNEIAKQVYQVQKSYRIELGIAIECRISISTKIKNDKLMRFYIEYHKQANFAQINSKRQHYYSLQRRLINPSLSDVDLKLYSLCSASINNTLIEAYYQGFYKHDPEYLEDYALKMYYYMLQLPQDEAEALIEESRNLKNKIKINVGPNFKLITD